MIGIALEKPGQFIAVDGPPPAPAPGDALVRVHRIGICGTDLHAFAGRQPFFSYPRILGHELGVEVIDPGSGPNGLEAGDRCSVEPYLNCGRCIACRVGRSNCCAELKCLGVHIDGGMRPELAVPARKLHRSRTLTYDQLALVETLAIGAHAVDRAAIGPDDFVLVIGAGPIGLSVSQFVQVRGATLAVMDVRKSRLALLASRNAIPNDFREIITLVESGRINLMPWITHRFDLADTPQRFPEIAANPDVIKTLIST
jgi:threonine dehydrogenase-like Zn-dependent dehydrogenase